MPRQQPRFSLPYTTTAGTITVAYNSGGPDNVAVTGSLTRYNSLTGVGADDLLTWVEGLLDAGTALVWSSSDPDGLPSAGGFGRARLRGVGTKYVTSITLPSWLATALGYTSTTPSVTVVGPVLGDYTSTVDSTYQRARLWIPQPASLVYYDPDDWRVVGAILSSQSPTGAQTSDDYGSLRQRGVDLQWIAAANARSSYLAATGYRDAVSANLSTSDPNHAWEQFVKTWRDLGGSCRFAPDVASPATYRTIYPDVTEPWWADPAAALEPYSLQPLRFRLRARFLEEE